MPEIVSRRVVRATAQEVYDACRSVDLHLRAGAGISAKAVGGRRTGLAELGDQVTWSARFFGIRARLTTAITHAKPPYELDDTMVEGLFRSFGHRYRISEIGGQEGVVELVDRFSFECPGGVLGSLFGKGVLLPVMRRAQEERMSGIAQEFN